MVNERDGVLLREQVGPLSRSRAEVRKGDRRVGRPSHQIPARGSPEEQTRRLEARINDPRNIRNASGEACVTNVTALRSFVVHTPRCGADLAPEDTQLKNVSGVVVYCFVEGRNS
jgi:hypothetical protein